MSEKSKYKKAVRFIENGDNEKASKLLLEIYNTTSNSDLKFKSIMALINALNSADDNKLIIKLCDDGRKITEKLNNHSARAYLMARKANCLFINIGFYLYKRKNLKLSPNWKNFALESVKNRYENLSEKIINDELEANSLFDQSIEVAQSPGNKELQARLLMLKGEAYGGKYLNYKMENIIRPRLLHFFKYSPLSLYTSFTKEVRKKIKESISISEDSFLESIKIFKSINNKSLQAYSYYNLALQLKTANYFKKAKKYILLSKRLAEEINEIPLLKKIPEMEKSIKLRNKDIPDYIHGERRETV